MREELTGFFLNTPAVKTRMLPRNVEGCWEWLSAVPWQHLNSKPHDVDLPASTVGDTMPASGHAKGHQRCHFTGSSGNKTHFPQVSGWDFASGPFLGSHVRKTLVYVILLFLPCFFLHTLSHFRGSVSQGDGALISLTHPIIQKKLITGFSPK